MTMHSLSRKLPFWRRNSQTSLRAGCLMMAAAAVLSFGNLGCQDNDPQPGPAPGQTTTGTGIQTNTFSTGLTNPTAPTSSSAPGTSSGSAPAPACVGIDPEAQRMRSLAYQEDPDPGQPQDPNPGDPEPECKSPTCIGDNAPYWELHDYQPQSCGYDRDYGINSFNGAVTMVVMLSGW